MYSNNIHVVFFFITLCFAPLIISVGADERHLRQNFYEQSCRNLEDIVWWGVWNATQSDTRMPASLLRLHFHDCFVNGCDASVLLDDPKGEKSATPNKNSLRGFHVIDIIKAEVEKQCPNTVSCADILTLAARVSVRYSILHFGWSINDSWQPWKVLLGRQDGMISNMSGANSDLPSPNDSVDTIIKKFAVKGLNTTDLVALSGAHTIGSAQCSSFKSRLYPKDPSMSDNLYRNLKNICPDKDTSTDTHLAHLERINPENFGSQYYENILNYEGVLKSDQALWLDKRTKWGVAIYSKDPTSFINDFGDSMVKMGSIDVITAGGRRKGEIRKICSSLNKKNN